MNILILLLTARTYPYQQNGDWFKGAIPTVWQLHPHNRRPDANRNAHRLPCQVCDVDTGWIGGGGVSVSIDAFWRGIPRFPD